mmetsp:Transcript_50815/g.123209  ORF Transcript_50815/g.123209 Transcript_50815/m.123209 type:complete len:277 (-) Transcript_50815:463-1293(-)
MLQLSEDPRVPNQLTVDVGGDGMPELEGEPLVEYLSTLLLAALALKVKLDPLYNVLLEPAGDVLLPQEVHNLLDLLIPLLRRLAHLSSKTLYLADDCCKDGCPRPHEEDTEEPLRSVCASDVAEAYSGEDGVYEVEGHHVLAHPRAFTREVVVCEEHLEFRWLVARNLDEPEEAGAEVHHAEDEGEEPDHLEGKGGQLEFAFDVVEDDEELLVSDEAQHSKQPKRLDEAHHARGLRVEPGLALLRARGDGKVLDIGDGDAGDDVKDKHAPKVPLCD